MKKILTICFTILINSTFIFGQVKDTTISSRVLPFLDEWGKEKGIILPYPFGVSAFYIYMARDVEVTDVTVEFLDKGEQSINDFSSFAVRNRTYVAAVKFDAWILPLLNLYVSVGYANTNAGLNADFTIERPISDRPPVEFDIASESKVNGPYTGVGGSLVGGYKSWFMLADANYGITWPDELENSVDFLFLSGRTGFQGKMGTNNSIRAWLGAAYLYSKTTINLKAPNDVLGEVKIAVYQHPLNPWTFHSGFMLTFDRFELMSELGSNFADASILVLSGSYRF